MIRSPFKAGLAALLACGTLAVACGSNNSGASYAAYCDKCAQCVTDSTFQEGFCAPYINGTSFDRAGCTNAPAVEEIDNGNVNLTQAQLQNMTCQQFDDAI